MKRTIYLATAGIAVAVCLLVLLGTGETSQQSVADEVRRLATEGNDPQAAIALANQYLSTYPERTMERQRVHYELAAAHWFAEDYDAALATFRQIVADYESTALDKSASAFKVDNAQFFIGVSELGRGRRAEGTAAFEQVVAGFPGSDCRDRALQALVDVYIEDGKPENGVAALDVLLKEYPDSKYVPWALSSVSWYLLSGEASPTDEVRVQNRRKAAAHLERIVVGFPTYDRRDNALQVLVDVCIEDGEPEKGVAALDVLLKEYPDSRYVPWAVRAGTGYLLSEEANTTDEVRAQHLEKVAAYLELVATRHPEAVETAAAHNVLLWHHVNRFEYAAAEPVARRVIELFPGTKPAAQAQMELAEVIVDLRREFETANALIDEVIVWAQEQEDVGLEAVLRWSKSRILVIERRCGESRLVAKEVLKFAQEHEDAAWLLIRAETQVAYAYFMEEQYETAADEFAAILEKYPEEESWAPFLKYYVGLSHFYAEETEKAREAFVRLVEDHPEDGWAYGAFNCMDLGIERPDNLWSPPEEGQTDE